VRSTAPNRSGVFRLMTPLDGAFPVAAHTEFGIDIVQ
jgi:hypothetical protein